MEVPGKRVSWLAVEEGVERPPWSREEREEEQAGSRASPIRAGAQRPSPGCQ